MRASASRAISYQFDHRFNDRWTFRQNARYVSSDVALKQVYGYGWANGTELNRYYSGADESLNAFAIDNQLQGKFETGAVKHTVLLGLDYQNRHADGRWDSGSASNLNAFHPDYAYGNVQITSRTFFDRRLEQTGFYLQDQLAYDRWRLILSGRQDEVRTTESSRTGDYASKQSWSGSKFTKRAGLVYLFDNGVSPYVSYSESFNPNAYTDQQGNLLPPTQSKQYEAGVKFQPPGTENMVTLAAFDLTQDNVANRVLAQTYYTPAGKVRSRGIELEGKARLTDNFTMLAAYTFTAMTYRESTEGLTGNTPYQAPRHMASLWGDYQFDSGLGVGAGVRYVGTSWADSANTLKVPAYTLVDLSVRYDLGRLSSSLKGMSVRVAANNLLDKTYVASCASLNYCYYGEERNVGALGAAVALAHVADRVVVAVEQVGGVQRQAPRPVLVVHHGVDQGHAGLAGGVVLVVLTPAGIAHPRARTQALGQGVVQPQGRGVLGHPHRDLADLQGIPAAAHLHVQIGVGRGDVQAAQQFALGFEFDAAGALLAGLALFVGDGVVADDVGLVQVEHGQRVQAARTRRLVLDAHFHLFAAAGLEGVVVRVHAAIGSGRPGR
ncbi:hypothetical protein G6F35_008519 [Rhizopus arrhizus]|nr:hypothetical protein G6F35_008519 [Rhizopus arrhizus]